MSISKEKRTKEQMMSLLDRAIEQEEALLLKVTELETALADCRKKAENPRHELEEQALPKSKVSFRLDFYRTELKGPLKGIIEHLPSRECRSFEGNRPDEIGDFIAPFIGTIAKPSKGAERPSSPKVRPVFPPEIIENAPEEEKKERSPLLKKLFPELFASPAPVQPKSMPEEVAPSRIGTESFLILTEGSEKHQRTLRRGQPFQIAIPMQTLDEFQDKPCSISLWAESLEKKSRQPLRTMEYCTPGQGTVRVPVRTLPFEQGIYRLVVSMTLRDEPQKSYYREDRLLIVQ